MDMMMVDITDIPSVQVGDERHTDWAAREGNDLGR